MRYYIYAIIANQTVVFVGCCKSADIPANSILLQVIERHPEVMWVKWSMRFAKTLIDKRALDNPYTRLFRNSTKLNRLLGETDFRCLSAHQNNEFIAFHERNSHLLDQLIQAELEKQSQGWNEHSMEHLLGDCRWSDTEIDRGDDRVKINARWSAWYSRVVQMLEPRLLGFFAIRPSIADGLVWIDGRSWQQFATEHEDRIRYELWSELPHSDWEYNQ